LPRRMEFFFFITSLIQHSSALAFNEEISSQKFAWRSFSFIYIAMLFEQRQFHLIIYNLMAAGENEILRRGIDPPLKTLTFDEEKIKSGRKIRSRVRSAARGQPEIHRVS
jgi:hypothetical protein